MSSSHRRVSVGVIFAYLETCLGEVPCVVLLDLNMPRMDGWETLYALRKIRADLPVVLTSGYEESQVMSANRQEKPQTFLHKPYRRGDLQAALARAMRNPALSL